MFRTQYSETQPANVPNVSTPVIGPSTAIIRTSVVAG